MTPPLDSFDDFIDDLLSSDIDLLKGELDFLLMQHIFQSINLDSLKDTEFMDKDFLAAWFYEISLWKILGARFRWYFIKICFSNRGGKKTKNKK